MTMADKRTAAFENIFGRPSPSAAASKLKSKPPSPASRSPEPDDPSALSAAASRRPAHLPLPPINTSLAAPPPVPAGSQETETPRSSAPVLPTYYYGPPPPVQRWSSNLTASASSFDSPNLVPSPLSPPPRPLYDAPDAAASSSSAAGVYSWPATTSPVSADPYAPRYPALGSESDGYVKYTASSSHAAPRSGSPAHARHHSRSSSTATATTIPHPAAVSAQLSYDPTNVGVYPLSSASSRSSSFAWPSMYPGAPYAASASAAAGGPPVDHAPPPVLLASWDQQQNQQRASPQPHPPTSVAALRGSRRISDASSVLDSISTPLSSTAADLLRSTPRNDPYDPEGVGSAQAYNTVAAGSSLSRNSSAGSNRIQPWTTSGSGGGLGSHGIPGSSGLRALTTYTSTHSSVPGSPESPAPGPVSASLIPGLHHKSIPSTLQHHWDNITGRRRRSAAAGSSVVPPASGLTPTTGSPPPMSQAASSYSPHRLTSSLPTVPPSTDSAIPSEYAKDRTGAKGSQASGTPLPSPSALSAGMGVGIYPALVSHVARAFRERVPVSERTKDGLRYKDTFEGRTAVDKLCQIIRTSDRNLALLVGRALDAQKFFHDVTYDHRLRDSTAELYQFQVRLAPGPGPTLVQEEEGVPSSADPLSPDVTPTAQDEVKDLPTGVFTLLTECYSPTCSPDRLCYSITCPRRLEQQARMHGRLPHSSTGFGPARSALGLIPGEGGGRTLSFRSSAATPTHSSPNTTPGRGVGTEGHASLDDSVTGHQDSDDEDVAPGALWAESVPSQVLSSVSERERKRQELINEVVVTERNFVRDLEYLRNEWLIPLRSRSDVIPEYRRDDFVTQLFWNVTEILGVHQKFCEALVQRAKRSYVVDRISDIFTAWVPSFEPFVRYGAHQLYGKYEFEQEKATNPAFAKFVDETERRPASRKLELNGYLTKPVTRLSRYPLLLHQVLKYTPSDHPDARELPAVIDQIKQLLSRVNAETGASANRFNLAQLDQQLIFKPGEAVDLRLRDPMRELVFRGALKRRAGVPSSESAELQVFLFDHALLLTKPKVINKQELFKVTRKPMPLELLVVTVYDELPSTSKTNQTRVRTTTTRLSTGQRLESVMLTGAPKQDAKQGYALTLTYLGRKGYTLTLWASTFMARQKWFEQIEHQQDLLRARSNIFNVVTLHAPSAPTSSANVSGSGSALPPTHGGSDPAGAAAPPTLRANCAVPFDFGRRIILGAQDGVYLSELRQGARPPTKVLPLANVTQIDVLEEFQLLLVLADRTLHTFLLDGLDPHDPVASLKRGRRIQGLVTFFRAGVCLGRTLVCVVKSSPLPSSTIRTLEPVAMSHQRSHHSHQPSSTANGPGDEFAPTANGNGTNVTSGSTRSKKRTGSQLHKLFPGVPAHTNQSGSGLSTSFGGKQSEALRVFKEFYIPMESTSVHFLKTKLCIAATKGFEIVDLDTLDTQALLDPADQSLDFVFRKEALKPIAIYRIHRDFLLCYDEFAFYVNKTGWRARGNWIIHWEGHPTAFAFHYPYVLAFEPSFIEVRHVGSGALHQIITGTSVKCLFSDIPPPPPPAQQAALRALYAQFNSLQLQQLQLQQQQAFASQTPSQHGHPYPTPPGYPLPLPAGGSLGTPPGSRSNVQLPATPGSGSTRPTPLPATPIPVNPMWESAHASRTPIVFGAGNSIFYMRRANAK